MPVARIDINRIDIAVLVSLLLHGLIALLPPLTQKTGEKASEAAPAPFIAKLVQAPRGEPAPEPVEQPAPVPKVARARPVVAPKSAPAAPTIPPVDRPAPIEAPPVQREPQFDMLAMINARKEQRREAEHAMLEQEEARSGGAQGSSDPMATIKRNLATLNAPNSDGTGGVFTLLSKGTRVGEFAFNGFRPDTNRRWREVIEVDAGQGGDVERAMVRRMIQLIRGHYNGDFIWRSHRLGKSITMSARPEHQAELEEFLIREFFDTPTLAHKQQPDQRYRR